MSSEKGPGTHYSASDNTQSVLPTVTGNEAFVLPQDDIKSYPSATTHNFLPPLSAIPDPDFPACFGGLLT